MQGRWIAALALCATDAVAIAIRADKPPQNTPHRYRLVHTRLLRQLGLKEIPEKGAGAERPIEKDLLGMDVEASLRAHFQTGDKDGDGYQTVEVGPGMLGSMAP